MRYQGPWRVPGAVALYLAFAAAWVAVSDRLVIRLTADPGRLTDYQTFKGWLFVTCTAVLLYLLLWRERRDHTRHSQTLRQSEEKYRALFEGLVDGALLITDRIIDCNDAMCRLWGCARGEIIGKAPLDFSPPIQPDGRGSAEALAALLADARGGTPQLFEWRYRRPDGTRFDAEVFLRCVTIDGQSMLEAIVHDITMRKRAEALVRESEARFRELAELLPQTVFEADLRGILTFSNRNGFQMFRYTQEDFDRGVNVLDTIIPDDRERGRANIARVLQGEAVARNAYVACRKDGTTFPVTIHATRILRDDVIVGLRGIVVDMTEWEQITQAVATHARQLEAVRAVSAEITQDLNLPTVLPLITQRACQLTGAVSADLYLWNDEAHALQPATGSDHTAGGPISGRLGQTLLGRVAQDRTGVLLNHYHKTTEAAVESANTETEITAALVEPLLYGDRLLGVLGLTHDLPHQAFSEQDQSTLRLFAAQAAIAIENARLYENAQRELRHRQRAETQLRTVARAVEQTSSMVVITDTAGHIQFVNPRFTEVTGYAATEALGQNPRILKGDATRPDTYHDLWATIAAGHTWRGEFLNRKKSGELYWEDASISPVRDSRGTITHYVAVKDDITERKRTEQALRTRTAQLEAIRRVGAEITQELDLTALITIIMQRATGLLHTTSGSLFLWNEEQRVLVPRVWPGHGEWMAEIRLELGQAVVGKVAQQRRGMIVNDYRASLHAHPLFLARAATTTALLAEPLLYHDRLLGVISVIHTDARMAFTDEDQQLLRLFADQAAIAIENARLYGEEQMRRRQLEAAQIVSAEVARELDLRRLLDLIAQRVSELIHNSRGSVWLWEDDSRTLAVYAVTAGEEWEHGQRVSLEDGLVGLVATRREGQIVNDYRAWPRARRETLERTEITAAMAEPLIYHDRLVGVLALDNGSSRVLFTEEDRRLVRLFANQAAVAIENARLYAEINRSFHDLQRAQEELVRAEKLRAIGQLSAGIAHDLNNVLAAILGQAELLRLKHAENLPPELETIVTAASDGAHIVRRLQDFGRQRPEQTLGPVQLDLVVSEALQISRPRWRDEAERRGHTITVETSVAGLPPVFGNASEIREALTNLILNAADAMPDGGRLSVTGRTLTEGPNTHRPSGVELLITDTGVGMPDDVRRRLFEPFFTTKGMKGTGLGLSMVYGIMNRHGGRIDVESTLGEGTTFRLRFQPAQSETAEDDPSAARRVTSPLSILFVDDDDAVRRALAQLLRAVGHTTWEADNAKVALTLLASMAIDLIVSDLGMAEMNGLEFARAVRATHPTTPILLCTGWNDLADGDDVASGLITEILQKPITLRRLQDAIERHHPRPV